MVDVNRGSKRLLPPVYVFISLVLMLALSTFMPVARIIAWPWNLAGLIPLVGGIAVAGVANRAFHRAGTTIKPFEESTTLVTGGAFRISRNPMYLGIVLLLAGVAILLGTVTPSLVVPLMAVLLDRRFIRSEEAMLRQKFGAEWLAYEKTVRRWL